jgi:hypothetical protein
VSDPPRLRIHCAGRVYLDGEHVGALDRKAYDMLAALAAGAPGFEPGDSMTFELRLAGTGPYPMGRAVMRDARDAKG